MTISITRHASFDRFNSPPHQSWKAHREALKGVTRAAECDRRAIGLVFIADAPGDRVGDLTLVPCKSAGLRTLVVRPPGWYGRSSRVSRVVVEHRGDIRYGYPAFTRTGESWDFSRMPFTAFQDGGRLVEPGPDVLPSSRPEFEALVAADWAVTLAAAATRRWAPYADAVRAAGKDATPVVPAEAFPVPWVAFPRRLARAAVNMALAPHGELVVTDEAAAAVVAAAEAGLPVRSPVTGMVCGVVEALGEKTVFITRADGGQKVDVAVSPAFTPAIGRGNAVRAGDVIGHDDLALGLRVRMTSSFRRKAETAFRACDGPVAAVLRLRVAHPGHPGMVLLPAPVVAAAALAWSDHDHAAWDVSRAVEAARGDYRLDRGIAFEPLPQAAWEHTVVALRGAYVDATPPVRPPAPRAEARVA